MSDRSPSRASERLSLPQVTLVAVTSVAVGPTLAAMQHSLDRVQFGEVIFLSDREPPLDLAAGVTWRKIHPLRSRDEYSHFLLHHLHEHVSTSHMLCVQWDGFVLNASAWQPEFLDYDYIGAPWPQFNDARTVGNGGFSLRSRRLMQICSNLTCNTGEAEDIWICRTARPVLEDAHGIRFAPLALASRFAYERTAPAGQEFGFHGVFNMAEVIGAPNLARLLAELEPELIARNEHWDMLRWALKRCRIELVWRVANRLMRGR